MEINIFLTLCHDEREREREKSEINKLFHTFNFLLISFRRKYRQGKYYAIYMITTSEYERGFHTHSISLKCLFTTLSCHSRFMRSIFVTLRKQKWSENIKRTQLKTRNSIIQSNNFKLSTALSMIIV